MFFNFLKKIDVFGFPINLTYQTKTSYKTHFGGFLTLGIISLYILTFYFFGKEVIIRKNPTTIYNQEFEENPASFQVLPNTFPFAFGLQDGNTWEQYIDETIYQVSVKNYMRFKNLNKQTGKSELTEKQFDVKFGPCNVTEDLSDIPDAIEYFQRLDVSQMYCLKKKQDNIPEVEGQWDSHTYKSLIISFSSCKNTTTYNKCKSKEVIDEKLKAGFLSMNYVDLTVNPRDPDHAYRYFGKDSYTFTSNQLTKNIDFFVKNVELSSDEGWLFEDIQQQHGVAYSDMIDMIDMRQKDIFCFFTLKLSSKRDVYSRQYKKIQNVMAEVEGFLKALLIICLFITIPITKLSFYLNLLNQLFLFTGNNENQDSDNNEEKDLTNSKSNQSQIKLKQQKTIQLKYEEDRKNSALANAIKLQQSPQEKRISKYQSQILQVIDLANDKHSIKKLQDKDFWIKSGGLKMTFSEKIRYIICPTRKTKKKMSKIKQTILNIKQHMDTVYILNKLQELDKIKLLLLTPNQLSLFDLLSKPIINLEDSTQQHFQVSLLNQEKSHFQKVKDAYQAYQKIDIAKADRFDKKLIELLDENVRQIFDKANEKSRPVSAKASLPTLFEKNTQQQILDKTDNIINQQELIQNDEEVSGNLIIPIEREDKIQIAQFVKGQNILR